MAAKQPWYPSDPSLLSDLLSFLLEAGRIAYYRPGVEEVEAPAPHLFGTGAIEEIGGHLDRWKARHPAVDLEALPD